MSTFLMIFVVLLNVGIAWWNTYAVGSVWNDTKISGSKFNMALLYSGAIQSVAGFSVPIILALTWVMTSYLSSGATPKLSADDVNAVWAGVMNLWYVSIIIPVVGSGFIIWGHSVKTAYEQRDWSSIGVASWNTFAQINNTVSMFNNLGPALKGIGGLTKKKEGLPILVLLIVVVSLLSSVLLTVYLIKHYAAKATSYAIQQRASMAR